MRAKIEIDFVNIAGLDITENFGVEHPKVLKTTDKLLGEVMEQLERYFREKRIIIKTKKVLSP
jgi:hypothetical protein